MIGIIKMDWFELSCKTSNNNKKQKSDLHTTWMHCNQTPNIWCKTTKNGKLQRKQDVRRETRRERNYSKELPHERVIVRPTFFQALDMKAWLNQKQISVLVLHLIFHCWTVVSFCSLKMWITLKNHVVFCPNK